MCGIGRCFISIVKLFSYTVSRKLDFHLDQIPLWRLLLFSVHFFLCAFYFFSWFHSFCLQQKCSQTTFFTYRSLFIYSFVYLILNSNISKKSEVLWEFHFFCDANSNFFSFCWICVRLYPHMPFSSWKVKINKKPRYAKWMVFVIELNLLLP